MAEKKKTPLQEAIEKIYYQIDEPEDTIDKACNVGLNTAIRILQSLLPKEKEFAKEIWDSPVVYYKTENKGLQMMSFDEYYKQFES